MYWSNRSTFDGTVRLQFYAEVMQCEYEMTRTVYRLYNDVNIHVTSSVTSSDQQRLQSLQLFDILQVWVLGLFSV